MAKQPTWRTKIMRLACTLKLNIPVWPGRHIHDNATPSVQAAKERKKAEASLQRILPNLLEKLLHANSQLGLLPRQMTTRCIACRPTLGTGCIAGHDFVHGTHVGDNMIDDLPLLVSRSRPSCRSKPESSKFCNVRSLTSTSLCASVMNVSTSLRLHLLQQSLCLFALLLGKLFLACHVV